MKKILQMPLFTIICLSILLSCSGCSAKPQKITDVDTAMGTVIAQQLYVQPDPAAGEEETGQIIEIVNHLEMNVLSWRLEESELARINKKGGVGEGVEISPDMAGILSKSLEVSEKSEGAFDITIGRVCRLWNLDEWADKWQEAQYPLPEEEIIMQELAGTGYENIVLNVPENMPQKATILLKNNVTLDLGAVGKGIALDEILKYLEREERITGATISAGGSILTYGEKPDGSAWKVGVVDPLDNSRNLGILTLNGQWCVSTSGDYERYVEVDGTRYHHIIDPDTGYPADSGVRSVTILCKDGFLSDALSTACFIMGVEQGMELAEEYRVEALFVDVNGDVTMTKGMEQYFHLSESIK